VKAGDYTLEKLDPGERAALQEVGANIQFLPFLPGFSTTQLIARIKAAGEI
jgi:bifunctional ADP-heptose synthase (sugar kinase/adenylyltransferase)